MWLLRPNSLLTQAFKVQILSFVHRDRWYQQDTVRQGATASKTSSGSSSSPALKSGRERAEEKK